MSGIDAIKNAVVDARNMAARHNVLHGVISNFDGVVFRPTVLDVSATDQRVNNDDDFAWGSLSPMRPLEQHAVDYAMLGRVKMAFASQFLSGRALDNGYGMLPQDPNITMLIEPYKHDIEPCQWTKDKPDWDLKNDDIIALIVSFEPKIMKWLQVVEIDGQALSGGHGKKYILNVIDDLIYNDTFKAQMDEVNS